MEGGRLKVSMSKLLMWYGGDVGPTAEHVLRWVAKYLKNDVAQLIVGTIDKLGMDAVDINYKNYDWTSNAKEDA